MIEDDDHVLADAIWPVHTVVGDKIELIEHPAVNAVNERLRQEYIDDCQRGMRRWNQAIKKAKIDFKFDLPHRAFHRAIGNFAEVKVSPNGKIVTEADWTRNHADWLPSDDDRAFVQSLMKQELEPGKFAGWIAPPNMGVNREDPNEFEYIRFN
jgi:benzoyl-CoA 2,3-dioxygenase component B